MQDSSADTTVLILKYTLTKRNWRLTNPSPFDPWEGIASNFSLQYHPWITHYVHRNVAYDHQLKKFLDVRQILPIFSTLGKVWRICILMLGCERVLDHITNFLDCLFFLEYNILSYLNLLLTSHPFFLIYAHVFQCLSNQTSHMECFRFIN